MNIANSTYLEQEYPGNTDTGTVRIRYTQVEWYPNNTQSKVIIG